MAKKILIVDDDDSLRGLIADFLEREGYDCIPAESVKQALAKMNEDRFELAISDFNMPCESGLDLLRYVSSESPATSFILMSGEVSKELKDRALELGALDCMAKPFRFQELLSKVETVMKQEEPIQTH